MALRGSLKDFSLPDVFQLITFSRKTGVLRITGAGEDSGSVWFREGEVFFAQSNWHRELLGERLVAAGKITRSALDKALAIRADEPEDGRRLGQVLVGEGYVTETVLEAFVQEQIQDTIFDLMRWETGQFDFELLPESVNEDIGLTVSIENVIMEGSRRLEEWARIRKKVPSMDVIFKMATAPGEGTFEISLKPIEWSLLLLIDGTRSVSDLARAAGRTDFEVARILYGLYSAGLLEFAAAEVSLAPEAKTDEEADLESGEVRESDEDVLESAEGELEPAFESFEVEPDLEVVFEPTGEASVTLEPMPEFPSEPTPPAAPEPRPAPEVPEFLISTPAGPQITDDASSFTEMLELVSDVPEVEIIPPAPYELAADLIEEFEPVEPEEPVAQEQDEELLAAVLEELPEESAQQEPEPETETAEDTSGVSDFERDLMALGMGELPEEPEPDASPSDEAQAEEEAEESVFSELLDTLEDDLIEPEEPVSDSVIVEEILEDEMVFSAEEFSELVEIVEEEEEPEPEPEPEPEEEPEPEPEEEPEEAAEPESEPEEEPEEAAEPESEPEEEPEPESEPAVKFDFEPVSMGPDFESEVSDELGALTGVRDDRPQVTVNSAADEDIAPGLRRDEAVDKALVLEVIKGLKKL